MTLDSIAAAPSRQVRWRRRAAIAAGAAGAALLLLPFAHASASTSARWHAAAQVPLPQNAAVRPQAALGAVACTGDGFCVAGGRYSQANGTSEAVIATQARGVWTLAQALLLPRDAAANPRGQVLGVACASLGDCVAVGSYEDKASSQLPFIATESRGRWTAAAVPLPANAAARAQQASLDSVACASGGACEAVGVYHDKAGYQEAMAAGKPARGSWSRLAQIPAPKGAARNPSAYLDGVACAGAGNCVAVGGYRTGHRLPQAMGAVEVRGRWRRAVPVAAPANRARGGYASLRSVSCLRDGRCAIVGVYQRPGQAGRPASLSLTYARGRFGRAAQVTALPAKPGTSPALALASVSCAPAGPCEAAGELSAGGVSRPATVLRTASGAWRRAAVLAPPGNAGAGSPAGFLGEACVSGGYCTAVGQYSAPVIGALPMAAWNG